MSAGAAYSVSRECKKRSENVRRRRSEEWRRRLREG
jgi:hypothetical protein